MITVENQDQEVSGFTSVEIKDSMDAAAVAFSLEISDPKSEKELVGWGLVQDEEILVKFNGVPVVRGYIDKLDVGHSIDGRSIKISGREITSNIIDSYVLDGKQFNDVPLKTAIEELIDGFGVSLKIKVTNTKNIKTNVKAGDRIFETIDTIVRQQGLMVTSNGLGELLIVNISSQKLHDGIVLGENVMSASTSRDHTQRFSEYYVKGQEKSSDAGWGPDSSIKYAMAVDKSVTRKRRKVIVAEQGVKSEEIEKRVQWEASVGAARSLAGSVDVRGWVQSNGELWVKNRVVFIDDREANLYGNYLVKSLTRVLKEDDFTTSIYPAPEKSFIPEPELKSEDKTSSIGWGVR